ncbi:MAG: DUF1588 domain-containing protein [Planctomycetota bacterium]
MWPLHLLVSSLAVMTAQENALGADDAITDLVDLTELVCMDCHRGIHDAEGAASVDLDAALQDPGEHLELLTTAFAQVRQGFMPPSDAPGGGFDDEERDEWLAGLTTLVARKKQDAFNPGRATVRRMSRRQIERSLRRLIGIDVPTARFLPRDASGYGYDTTGDTLFVTPLSFESWFECVDFAVEHMKPDAPAVAELTRGFARSENGLRSEAVARFLELAFSRPALPEEVEERVAIGVAAGENGAREVIRATLLSPGFLYRDAAPAEDSGDPPGGAYTVDGHTFALRASMFLHGARPTREVLRRAGDGAFATDESRRRLVDELLEGPDSISLAEDFATQWLGTAELNDVTPDVRRFRAFRRPLRESMLAESIAFFEDLVRHNRSALLCIDSDHVFVDRHLAEHYGMEGLKGIKRGRLRRVERQDPMRGGVLTMAGVLTVTSNPLRTSPVKRGQWVLERLLHAPAPPAPPNAGTLPEDDTSAAGLTLREQLEQHRASPACASCHDQMDPFGLALEVFDGIGKRRDVDAGTLKTTLADGTVITGPAELKTALLASPERFLEALASNLFTYATGRPPTLVDLIELREAIAACRDDGFAIRTLIRGVALTAAMTHTRARL